MSPTAEATRRQHADSPSIVSLEPEAPMKAISREEVEQRAYQRFLDRGGLDGRDIDDWLEAERELLAHASLAAES